MELDSGIKLKLYEDLVKRIQGCVACNLYKGRKRAVLGYGNLNADLLFIGEAPGCAEDNTGLPFASGQIVANTYCAQCAHFKSCFRDFIGTTNSTTLRTICAYVPESNTQNINENRQLAAKITNAGMVLDDLLVKVGKSRVDVFLTNIVSCRPVTDKGKNGKPTLDEIKKCYWRLKELLTIIQPRALVFVGAMAYKGYTGQISKMGDIVGTQFKVELEGVAYPSTVIYHPAALLYSSAKYDDYMMRSVDALNLLMAVLVREDLWSND